MDESVFTPGEKGTLSEGLKRIAGFTSQRPYADLFIIANVRASKQVRALELRIMMAFVARSVR